MADDMTLLIWNVILTLVVGLVSFFLRAKIDEVDDLRKLVNKTREEIARDHVPRAEMNDQFDKLLTRIDTLQMRLEAKMESLVANGQGRNN